MAHEEEIANGREFVNSGVLQGIERPPLALPPASKDQTGNCRMTTFKKITLGALGSVAVLGGAFLVYLTRTESGFTRLLRRIYNSEFPDVAMIGPDELAERLGSGHAPLLIDVRTPEEYAVSHLRNAQLIDSVRFTRDDVDDIDPDREVVVYCSIGNRGGTVARRMGQLGFTNVSNLYGGLFLWYNQGRPVYRGEQPVEEVHPFDRLWGQFITRGGKRQEAQEEF
jgi:rhodanese-related sulfurtransferase